MWNPIHRSLSEGSPPAAQELLSQLADIIHSGSVAAAGSSSSPVFRARLRAMLEGASQHQDKRVRFMAACWTTRVFPPADCAAQFICITLSGDRQAEVRQEAMRGLERGGVQLPDFETWSLFLQDGAPDVDPAAASLASAAAQTRPLPPCLRKPVDLARGPFLYRLPPAPR